jgi:hypothetical protein
MSLGHQLERAELYSVTEEGKRIRPKTREWNGMHVRETRPHALSRGVDSDLADAQLVALQQAALQRVLETKLTKVQRDVFELQQRTSWVTRTVTMSTAEKQAIEAHPDTLSAERLRGDAWSVRRRFETRMTHAAIAAELGLTPRQVRTAIETAHRILRACSLGV